MIELSLRPVVTEGFSMQPLGADEEITVKLTGNADMAATPILATWLPRVHADAVRLNIRLVTFDLRELYFMNSSCLKCFASMLTSLRPPREGGYEVRFLASATLHWQSRSLGPLQAIAKDNVKIERAS